MDERPWKQDMEAAAKWFAEAGGRGVASGDYNLAGCYERGCGVPREVDKARKLYARALRRGVFKAHLALGYLAVYLEAWGDTFISSIIRPGPLTRLFCSTLFNCCKKKISVYGTPHS